MDQINNDLIESLNYKLDIESKLEEKQYEKNIRYSFNLGNIGFILPKELICELIENPTFTYIPKMPKIVLGLCNVRGNLVPVINLHNYFKLEIQLNKFLLVMGQGQNAVGVLLDVLPFSVDEDELDEIHNIPSLPGNLDQFVFKAFHNNDSILIEYNHEELFKSLCKNN
ncbi:MAG: chemotaxis protein CheW [Marinicellaceae bacterium]